VEVRVLSTAPNNDTDDFEFTGFLLTVGPF